MAIRAFTYNSWAGGQAVDKKIGLENSFANSQSLDFRKSPSQLSVLPRTRRADSKVVTDLVQNEVMTEAGVIYAIGSAGNVYRVTSGVWALFGNIGESGTFGISYRQDQDAIYITGETTVSLIKNVSTTPTLEPGYFNESKSTYDNSTQAGFNVDSDQSDGMESTLILTTFVENDEQEKRYFQTDIQPITKIGVRVLNKGTGNWTMTVHDGLNNVLGTDTLSNATLVNGSFADFEFTPMKVNVGPNAAQTYHFHLTSTVADGTVYSTDINDLSSCDMQLYADRLIDTVNGLHPMETFQQFELIGNGRYLSAYEDLGEAEPSNTAWARQKLSFPPGYEVCGVTKFNEYVAIAMERVTSNTSDPQDGIIFYWDGLSTTYNYFTPIPEGSPEGLTVYQNALHYTAGGDRYIITSVAATPEKYRKLPFAEGAYTASNSQTQVYPYTSTIRNGILLFAWPSITTNQELPYGVYSWGSADYTQPTAFGYSYIISTGSKFKTVTNNLTIGMVKNFGSILHISWRDGSAYGVDVVDADSIPAEYATCESLIEDSGITTKQKQVSHVEAKWLTIDDGVSIVLKYSINRGDWVYSSGATSNAAGGFSNSNKWGVDDEVGYGRLDIGTSGVEERFYEVEFGIDIYCDDTVTSPPVIVGMSAPYDDLGAELLI